MVRGRPEPSPALLAQVSTLALALPRAREEEAWTGLRWRVGGRTFAHVTALHHADAVRLLGAAPDAVVTVVTLRSAGDELAALLATGPPFLAGWGPSVVTMVLDEATDWTEVGELLAESYRLLAPARLVRQLDELHGFGPG